MSNRRLFFALPCDLARNPTTQAAEALERIEGRALDLLAVAQAERAILEGWKQDRDQGGEPCLRPCLPLFPQTFRRNSLPLE